MATPNAATSVGLAICTSWVGQVFPSLCAAGAAADYLEARASIAQAAGESLIEDVGDEVEDVVRASAEPIANAADIARWTTIGIIAIAVVILVLVALFVFFYLRGFR
jgi:hypothetical protein